MRPPQLADNLRRAVLQAAIEGKLNDRTNENARDLLAAIQTEKAAQQKTGKLKKDKPLAAISEEEIPFAIPENWVWVRLGEVTDYGIGKQTSPEKIPMGALVIEMEDIEKDTYRLLEKHRKREPKSSKNSFFAGDILYGKLRPYLKKAVVADEDGFCSTEIIPFSGFGKVDSQYLLFCMTSPFMLSNVNQLTYGMDMPRLGTNDARNLLIPLPPLTEQQQIVAKLNQLLTEIDELKAQEQALLATQNAFPKKLRAALLQAAVQGELNERTNENARDLLAAIQAEKTALQKAGKLKKDKPLAAISEEEIPFTIPENWVWVRLGDLCQYVQRGKSPQYSDIQQYPVISQKCVQWTGFDIIPAKFIDPKSISSYSDERILRNDDLLWNSTGTGTVGRIVKYHTDFNPYSLAVADSHVTILRLFSCINVDYIEAFIKSPTIQSNIEDLCTGSTKQKELSLGTITNLPIPLPPLTEQQQIVAKLETLLAEIDTLENAA